MRDQVEEVKTKTDIVAVIGEHLDLKKAGRNYKALCPFHSEKTPSFMVSPELQIFKCFGCGESGDVYSFLQKYEGMDFAEALKFLADRAGIKLSPLKSPGQGLKQLLYEINFHAAKFYHFILLNHSEGKEALVYLTKQRKIKPETIKTFQLGFSPNVPFALRKYLIDKKGFKLNQIEKAGICYTRNGRVFDRFRGRIVFPLFDHRGNAVGFSGRILPSEKSKGLAKYINSPETLVYSKSRILYGLNLARREIKKRGSAVVVEGNLDVVSSWQAGVKNVVAINGTALTEDQIRLLGRLSKKLILALDADMAGDAAARRGIDLAQTQGLEVEVLPLGKYQDPDEMIRHSPEVFKKALKKTIGVWDFVISSVFAKHDATTAAGKAKIGRELAPVLASISDQILQAHYLEMVAKRLNVPTEAVAAQLAKSSSSLTLTQPPTLAVAPKKKKSRRELLEERLLTLAFQEDPQILLKKKVYSLVTTPLAARIIKEFRRFFKKQKTFDPSEFAASLPKELVEGFADLILKDVHQLLAQPEAFKREQELIFRELEILTVKDRLLLLGKKIKEYERKGEKTALKKAEERFRQVSQKLLELEASETEGIIL